MESSARIRKGQSCAADPREAVRQFHAAVAQPSMVLVMFFCSSEYDLDLLADEMKRLFSDVQVIGCTTAGEIGPAGYREHSLTGASFPTSSFNVVSGHIDQLQQFEAANSRSLVQNLLQKLESLAPGTNATNSFAWLLIDGLSVREEPVANALQNALGEIPLVGGSAGDGLSFGKTRVYFEGAFHCDSAVLVLVATRLPFRVFKTQHFVPDEQRGVVTAADAEHRIVKEIDGWPATEGYMRLLGVDGQHLDSMLFAASPLMVLIEGTNYVRSIQKANPDGSLTFLCAIEEGLVLRGGRGVDLIDNLKHTFAGIRTAIGPPQLVLGCDCFLRKLEIAQRGLAESVEAVFLDNNVIGFNSYGEQYRGVHINQTLTGIAIGEVGND